ncbi:hypothetical protein [Chitinophaga ginsengisegetis]|uniref:hypothetical protein n=1 Tax=Chitinophaga ginsengisegetis TaxID=393003 RepID=UPI000DBA6D0A|nr:hypothetical protein [Chitinophaga ginsengisegetis]MDR6571364.1 hypothetical protein [Chitinophaga ginsengisegetis]MDR6651098.1 hypothetical protein [Chitinophaga ginsengisegetis]MDR6657449.1 hypothetical protein [Chitinophaga ginsengisegetis]
MENLLTILTRITACGTSAGFIELVENELCNVIGSTSANNWSPGQRAEFMAFYTVFRTTATAAFNIKDALERAHAEDLTRELVAELESDLYELSSFQAGIELDELVAALDQYIEILVDGDKGIDGTIAAITGNYFRTFFLTLHSLEIEERISIAKINHHFSTVLYEY